MSQLRRQLDHDFRVWSQQLTYSLFGNTRGRVCAGGPEHKKPLWYAREMRWESKYHRALTALNVGREGSTERAVNVAWLRWQEVV